MTDARHQRKPTDDHKIETDGLEYFGGDEATEHHADKRDGAENSRGTSDEACDVRQGNDYTADPDSGFFGVGSNEGEGNDNLERETTPGYQADKWDRGTIMPR